MILRGTMRSCNRMITWPASPPGRWAIGGRRTSKTRCLRWPTISSVSSSRHQCYSRYIYHSLSDEGTSQMDTTQYRLRVTFTTPILGTQPQKDIAVEYLMSKVEPQETADELDTLPEALEKGTRAFHKLNGKPIYYDYHIRGFLKNAGSVFNGLRG